MRCLLPLTTLLLLAPSCQQASSDGGKVLVSEDFTNFDDSGLPVGWRVGETNGNSMRAQWGHHAEDGKRAYGVLDSPNVRQTYNMSLLDGVELADFDASFEVKALTGEEDQGGGLVWRAQGFGDYYIARWNPLEDNLRFYKVVGSKRRQLASSSFKAEPTAWHRIRIATKGSKVRIWFNGDLKIEHEDATFAQAGKVGFWTKADASTVFANLRIR